MRQKTRIKDHESKKDTAEKKLKNYMSLALKAHNILNEQDAQEISFEVLEADLLQRCAEVMESQKKTQRGILEEMDRSQNLDDQLSILNEEKQKLKEELDALQTKMQSMSKEHSTAIDKCKRYEERAKKYHHDNEVLRENIHKLQRMLSDTQDSNDIQKIEQEKIIRNLENQLETVSVVSSRVSSKGDRDKDSSKNLGVDQQIVDKLKTI